MDLDVGLHLSDQFTFHMAAFLARLAPNSTATLGQLVEHARGQGLSSTLVPWASSSSSGGRGSAAAAALSQALVADFFMAGGDAGEGEAKPGGPAAVEQLDSGLGGRFWSRNAVATSTAQLRQGIGGDAAAGVSTGEPCQRQPEGEGWQGKECTCTACACAQRSSIPLYTALLRAPYL